MKLSTVLKSINSTKDIDNFLKDLCTPSEIEAMEERWEVAKLLYKGDSTYRDIASKLNTSTATVTRVARFLYKESNQTAVKVIEQVSIETIFNSAGIAEVTAGATSNSFAGYLAYHWGVTFPERMLWKSVFWID